MATPLAKVARSGLVCRPLTMMVAGSLLVTVPAMSRAIEAGSLWKPPRAQPIVSTISRFACSTTSGGRSS